MTRFFWRIFLSTWAIALISVALALYASKWLSNPAPTLSPSKQVTELVARDLRVALAEGTSDPSIIAERYAIDLSPMLEVFILDEEGNDVLGRDVPGEVFRAVVGEEYISWLPSDWLQATVVSEDLSGYTVVSYQGVYVVGAALSDPKVRLLFILVALILSASISLLLAHFIIKPVTRLREAGRLVASGDLSVRVLPELGQRQDALAELARDFDFMTERVADSLTTQRQLMRDVSHELRSPLARLQALVSVAGQRRDSNDLEFLQRLEGELDRLDMLIGEILSFSKLQTQQGVTRTPTDIVDLVQTIVDDACIETLANENPI
ncbi:MAG: histidine kinase dimerization/phospho-acceptor domain-containing protein, partial [Pseudomonadota bacterium]